MDETYACQVCGMRYNLATDGPCELCGGEKVPESEVYDA